MKLRALARPTGKLSGRGIHGGEPAELRILPAPPGAGLTFRRADLPGAPELGAGDVHSGRGADGGRTMLVRGGASVQTVEHVAAAVWGLGLDDAVVELWGPEPPAMDGSARCFVEELLAAGIAELAAERPVRRLRAPLVVGQGQAALAAVPAAGGRLLISYRLDYPGEPLAQGQALFEITPEVFAREIAPARTFCPFAMVEKLRALGWGKGADTQNTLVLQGGKVLENTLRFPDETVRHKILDVVGDLAFLGSALAAEVRGTRSGHNLNRELLAGIRELRPTQGLRNGGDMLFDINKIREFLPHRYPFLLVDRVIECETGKRILGYKNLTANEPFFQGHFPEVPVMPGVLQIEALAQLGGVLMAATSPETFRDKLVVLASIDKVKLRRAVVPGDQLMMEVRLTRMRGSFGEVEAEAKVDGQLAVEAQIRFALVPKAVLAAGGAGPQ